MKNPMSLEGRTVVVTGGAQGIGRSVVEMILELGGSAVAVDRDGEKLAQLVSELGGERLLPVTGDIIDPDFATDMVAQAVSRFGAVHGLVNNAGITRPAMIDRMTIDQWRQVLDVNLTGAFLCLQAVGRHMLARERDSEADRGSIVNISSDAARRGTTGQINYGAAKAGIFGLSMAAATEWAKHGIRSNTVCFGLVETPMTEVIRGERFRDKQLAKIPMGRWSTPEEAAQPVCYLLSDASTSVTGQTFSMNGGSHMHP